MPEASSDKILQSLDSAASRVNAWVLSGVRWLLLAVVGVLALAAVAYAGLWLLDLLSWGSTLEDYQPWLEGQSISTDKPADCVSPSNDSPGSGTVHISPREC